MGLDGSYAYQWGRAGDSADYQIEQNHDFAVRSSEAKSHHIPTVSVGFNCVGRGFNRSGFISEAEHLKVCCDIKKLLEKYHTGTWKDNTLIVSTWNEYSEGHLVAPTLSIGYTLLDNIRRVFTENAEDDYSNHNVRPTECQLERITRMYPPKYAPLRQLFTEPDDVAAFADPNKCKAIRSFSMDCRADAEAWKPNECISYVKIENGVLHCVADRLDPNIMHCESYPATDIDAIHIRMRCKTGEGDLLTLFFATEAEPNYTGSKAFFTPICQTDEFVDYYLLTKSSDWSGNIVGFRLDAISGIGSFEISNIDFLKSTLSPIEFFVEKAGFNFPFTPIAVEDDFEIAIDKMLLFKLGLYYEYDRWTDGGKLLIKDRADNTYVFRNGCDCVTVNGKSKALGYAVKVRDGLPVVRLRSFLSVLGRKTEEQKESNELVKIYV